MLDQVKDFSKKIKYLKEVLFVLFDKKSYDVWNIKL
jgi:hypothetical protein